MPHFSLEYSANLESRINLQGLCEITRIAALETDVFPLGGVRVRTHRCDHFAIADLHPQNAFIHLTVSVGSGRDTETRKRAGDHIFAAVEKYLAIEINEPYFALSMEMREIDPTTTWKRNTIHPRLKSK
ncbi:5-carboxymethyl-2-hydroxymuconate isomerase [Amylibacter kogurei]|uniref:5-carboxymethyl-2-hydroxymuconate isomerase n=1 Tax=Paramylibacter kogurei TaxID=1889778 RepID=A0A2G5KBC0_9RHOB|nr:5-carboxymethyl-2-hydroxymuconate Delta-isomerase [Amylibacter kogurei]PIB26170.1 5-carboxymethyl-2-hydroxymuconate isomerase [Amylibacter kogurei]